MEKIGEIFASINDMLASMFASMDLAKFLDGLQNFLNEFGKIAKAFFDALP